MDTAPPAVSVEVELLGEHNAYWDACGELTADQERWKAVEHEYLRGFIALGQKPTDQCLKDFRNGKHERDAAVSRKNFLMNRAKLARWRREGFTFDSERRLVAPPAPRMAGRPTRQTRATRTTTISRNGSTRRTTPSGRSPDDPSPGDGDPPGSRPRGAARVAVSGVGGDVR
jgi:hypothetical protein